MKLYNYKLGDLIKQSYVKNADLAFNVDSVRGISINKVLIPTKADMTGVPLKNYLLIKPNYFTYVPVTSRNGEKISICFNDTNNTFICSSTYVCFYVERVDILDPKYLFMYFNRPEFDRYARFNSWGSARETFDWSEMCNITIEIPPLEVQRKCVAVYDSMKNNQKIYESGLEDLKLTCDQLYKQSKSCNQKAIKSFLWTSNKKNTNRFYKLNDLRGINEKNEFMKSRDSIGEEKLDTYYIVEKNQFAMNFMCLGNFGKFYFAYNNERAYIVSPACTIFDYNEETIIPNYLLYVFQRDEFQRKCVFYGDGNTRGGLSVQDFLSIKIPVPELKIQKAIGNIYHCYVERSSLNRLLDAEIKNICPILIKGSLKENTIRKGIDETK